VLRSNVAPPDFLDEDQRKVMERSLTLIRDVMEDSPFDERQ